MAGERARAPRILGRGVPAALLALTAAGPAWAGPDDRSIGVWRNPVNSVHVRFHGCGAEMCGTVIWANEEARNDAREGGTDPLVGARLFTGFRKDREGVWHGKVFVPDIDKTFSGSITLLDANRIKGKGCLFGRIFCKSQIWVRVSE